MNEQEAACEAAVPEANVEVLAAPAGLLPLPTWRVVFLLALPVLAQQGLYFTVNLSDLFLAGHLPGTPEQMRAVLSARTTAHYVAWFITCYNVLVTTGSTALVARFIGAGERRLAVAVTHQSLLLACAMAVTASVVGLAGGLDLLVYLLRLSGPAAGYAVAYLQPIFLLLVFQIVEVAGIACLVGAGDTRTGLWVMIGVALVNIPLAWIFGWGLEIGFVGIAIGTALSHMLGGIVVLLRSRADASACNFSSHCFAHDSTCCIGCSASACRRRSTACRWSSASSGFSASSIIWVKARPRGIATAAHGIAIQWEALGYLSGAAFGTAAMTLVGQNLGAGRPEQAAKGAWLAFGLGCLVMSLMGAIFYVLAPQMFALFCPKPEQAPIIALGVPVLRLVAFCMPALASTIVFTYALRGAGDTRVPVLFTWIGFFVVRIPLAYYLTAAEVSLGPFGTIPGLDLGLLGAWYAMFADIVVRGAFFLWRFARGAWKVQKV